MKTFILLACMLTGLSQKSYAQEHSSTDSLQIKDSSSLKDEDIIFTKVETEPQFPGGEAQWRLYLRNNLDANVPVKNGAPAGMYTVVVRFVITRNGTIGQVVAETSKSYGMENEAMRIISNSPKWIPAKQNGYNVNIYRRQPFTFVVQDVERSKSDN